MTKITNPLIPSIIYENDDFLIINKPAGMVVHHDHHHQENTIVDFIQNKINFPQDTVNPGIVHRLDKVTSGLIIVARNLTSWMFLKKILAQKEITRKYYALVKGEITTKQFKIDVSLTKPGKHKKARPQAVGSKAITSFQVIKNLKDKTLLECQLETGRTHQIRAHLKFIKHPIINDPLYYGGKSKYIYLHAYFLEFIDPKTNKKISFTAQLPDYFQKIIN